jgi:hypothetical protein
MHSQFRTLDHSHWYSCSLAVLSFTTYNGLFGGSASYWDDWLALVKCSKTTLHTLELNGVDDIPVATLAAALALVGPSLRRLFYGSSNADLEVVVTAALRKCRSLLSVSPSSTRYKFSLRRSLNWAYHDST